PLTNFPTPALTGSGSKGRHAARSAREMASQPPAGAPLVLLEKSRLRRSSRNINFVFGGKKRGFCRLSRRVATPGRSALQSRSAATLAAAHSRGQESTHVAAFFSAARSACIRL